jgi:hypothetical protein
MDATPEVVEEWDWDDEVGVHSYTIKHGDEVVLRAAITPTALLELGKSVVMGRIGEGDDDRSA